MNLYLGQIVLTGELLDRVLAPVLLRRYRFLNRLRFEIAENTITAQLAGRYALFRFSGFVSAELLLPGNGEPDSRIDLKLYLELRPRFLNLPARSLLKKYLTGRPGITWSVNRLSLDLEKASTLAEPRESLGGGSIASLFRVSLEKNRGSGIPVNLYLRRDTETILGYANGRE